MVWTREQEVSVGARERTVVRNDSEWSPLPAPGRSTWHYGFAILPLVLWLMPWLADVQTSEVQGAAAFEIDGDRITRLIPAVGGTGTPYVVGDEGLYRGDATGANWEFVTAELPTGEIVAAADDSALMLAGDAPACGRGDGGSPLSRSMDGGATWREVSGIADIRPLALWGGDQLALGGSCEGLQLSLDNGDSWSLVEGLTLGQAVTAFAVVDAEEGRRVLIGTTGEGGTSQLFDVDLAEPAAPEVSAPLKSYYGVGAVAGAEEQRLLAATDGVWISIDQGQEWTLRASGLDEVVLSVDPLREDIPAAELERGFGLNDLALDPTNASQLALGSIDGLYTSDSAGAEWARVDGIDGDVAAVLIADQGGLVLVETEDGVQAVRPWNV